MIHYIRTLIDPGRPAAGEQECLSCRLCGGSLCGVIFSSKEHRLPIHKIQPDQSLLNVALQGNRVALLSKERHENIFTLLHVQCYACCVFQHFCRGHREGRDDHAASAVFIDSFDIPLVCMTFNALPRAHRKVLS